MRQSPMSRFVLLLAPSALALAGCVGGDSGAGDNSEAALERGEDPLHARGHVLLQASIAEGDQGRSLYNAMKSAGAIERDPAGYVGTEVFAGLAMRALDLSVKKIGVRSDFGIRCIHLTEGRQYHCSTFVAVDDDRLDIIPTPEDFRVSGRIAAAIAKGLPERAARAGVTRNAAGPVTCDTIAREATCTVSVRMGTLKTVPLSIADAEKIIAAHTSAP